MISNLATVVVPAYNVAPFIADCIESLLRQTYRDIEILVVDDGSADDTAKVVETVTNSDSRVRFFRNENHGVSYSRNYAIDQGQGEYLLFVDADDLVAPDYVETLVQLLERNNAECSAVGITPFEKRAPLFGKGLQEIYRNEEVYESILDKCKGFLWNKGYLYSVIQQYSIRLNEEVSQSEDMLFLLEYLSHCDTLAFDDGVRYGYRQRPSSATHSNHNTEWFTVLTVYEEYLRRLGNTEMLDDLLRRNFLPIAYEGLWRYRKCGLEDAALFSRLASMREHCEVGLTSRPFAYQAKMFVLRNFMGLERRAKEVLALCAPL